MSVFRSESIEHLFPTPEPGSKRHVGETDSGSQKRRNLSSTYRASDEGRSVGPSSPLERHQDEPEEPDELD